MQKDSDVFISNNDRDFIVKALIDECRLDGRKPYDFRKIGFKFSLDGSTATISLGNTRVMTVVTASLEAPSVGRPMEGMARFNVELSPMASPAFEPYGGGLGFGSRRQADISNEIVRVVERVVKDSGALDLESLCVVSGRSVWILRIDIHVLNHDGNLIDACVLSAVAALRSFRRPDVEIRPMGGGDGSAATASSNDEIIIHSPEVREPHPLTMHHLPMSITFALYEDGNVVAVDPSVRESAAAAGSCTVAMNATSHDVCAIQKVEGGGLTAAQFGRCVRLAAAKIDAVAEQLMEALAQHEVARVQARVRRHRAPTPSVTISEALVVP
uniref:Uncharacterized protein n=1 Tax=Polytomella parva TaxID=51329 RepID=A0A7S0YRU4_9CHLO|mmetsp:Transcript_34112/g.61500  ORF Transcript_34112/g.61500 Transcript_34112/m.61500 type:complete len:328 (+) Transcript_34112:69-1052(+)